MWLMKIAFILGLGVTLNTAFISKDENKEQHKYVIKVTEISHEIPTTPMPGPLEEEELAAKI